MRFFNFIYLYVFVFSSFSLLGFNLEETNKPIQNQYDTEESSDFDLSSGDDKPLLSESSDFDLSSGADEPLLSLSEENEREGDTLSKKSYLRYVANFNIKNLPRLTPKQSCLKAYKYFSKNNIENGLFAKARILIEKECFINTVERDSKIKELLKELDGLTTKSRSKEEHYKKIFQGKLNVALKKHTEAYEIFMQLRAKKYNFTKTYLVDIAELIIVYDFIPQNMTYEQALEFAQVILGELPKPSSNSSSTNADVLSSLHTSSVNTKNKTGKLLQAFSKKNKVFHPRYIPHHNTQRRISNISNNFDLQNNQQVSVNNDLDSSTDDLDSSNDENSNEYQFNNSINDSEKNQTINSSTQVLFNLNEAPTIDLLKSLENFSMEAFIRSEIIKIKGLIRQYKYKESDKLLLEIYSHIEGDENFVSVELLAEIYVMLGNARYTDTNIKNRAEWYLNALELLKNRPGTEKFEAQAYIGLGNASYQGEQAEWFNQAFKRLKNIPGTEKFQAQAYIGLGNARYTDTNIKNHAEWYLKALERLKNIPGTETLQAQAYIGLGHAHYTDTNIKNHAEWYLNALKCVKNIPGTETLQAQAYIGLGNALYQGNSIKWYLKALERLKNIPGTETLQAQANIGLGNALYQGNGIEWYLNALELLKNIPGTETLQAQAYIGLGHAHYTDTNIKNHAEWYLNALKRVENIHGTEKFQAQAYIGLGHAHYTDTNIKNYAEWFNQALKLLKNIPGTETLQAQAYIGLGNARYTDTNIKNYAEWFNQALKLLKNIPGTETLQAQANIGLGNALRKAEYYDKARIILEEMPNIDNLLLAKAYQGLGRNFFRFNEINSPDKWYNKGLSLLDPGHNLYKEIKKSLDNYNKYNARTTNRYGNDRDRNRYNTKPYAR